MAVMVLYWIDWLEPKLIMHCYGNKWIAEVKLRIGPSAEKEWSMSWTSQFPTPLISMANEMEPTVEEPDDR